MVEAIPSVTFPIESAMAAAGLRTTPALDY